MLHLRGGNESGKCHEEFEQWIKGNIKRKVKKVKELNKMYGETREKTMKSKKLEMAEKRG